MPHAVSPDVQTPQEHDELPDAPSDAQETSMPVEEEAQKVESTANGVSTSLENMFDDDDDDEFPTSSAAAEPLNLSHEASYTDPEVMRAFYQRLCPFRYLFQWLNHSPSPTNDFAHREFAFTLPNDVYLRYQSFQTADLFRKQCVAQIPSRFEIGPVYSADPRDRKTLRRNAAFKPIAKELVFDIDMTDYDEIRTCCSAANICHKCWSFIRMAMKVVDVALREDFGFKHILWVYSGRRGVHAWVCDKRARGLDDSKRKAIATYMELLKGGDASGKKVNAKRPLHPHIERSLRILREHFQADILQDQDPWASPEKAQHLLSLLPDKQLSQALSKKWESAPSRSSSNKWADIDTLARSGGASASLDPKKLLESKQDIVLEYTYPRLDAEVSKHLNHLLKSPFVVHPKTGRVCVPIDMAHVDDFDPLTVPTVTELLSEIDRWAESKELDESADKKVQDWEKTSLRPYVDHFRSFISTLLKDEQGGKRARDDSSAGDAMEF